MSSSSFVTTIFIAFYNQFAFNIASTFDSSSNGQFKGQQLNCLESEECTIICDRDTSCQNAQIYCPQDHLCSITCSAYDACRGATIHCPINSYCQAICDGMGACWTTQFSSYGVLSCNGDYSCMDTQFPVPPATTDYTLNCDANECEGATIYCPTNANCDISCIGRRACINAIITWPVDATYTSSLTCSGTNACSNVDGPPTSTTSTSTTSTTSTSTSSWSPTYLPTMSPSTTTTAFLSVSPTTSKPTTSTPWPTTSTPTTSKPTTSSPSFNPATSSSSSSSTTFNPTTLLPSTIIPSTNIPTISPKPTTSIPTTAISTRSNTFTSSSTSISAFTNNTTTTTPISTPIPIINPTASLSATTTTTLPKTDPTVSFVETQTMRKSAGSTATSKIDINTASDTVKTTDFEEKLSIILILILIILCTSIILFIVKRRSRSTKNEVVDEMDATKQIGSDFTMNRNIMNKNASSIKAKNINQLSLERRIEINSNSVIQIENNSNPMSDVVLPNTQKITGMLQSEDDEYSDIKRINTNISIYKMEGIENDNNYAMPTNVTEGEHGQYITPNKYINYGDVINEHLAKPNHLETIKGADNPSSKQTNNNIAIPMYNNYNTSNINTKQNICNIVMPMDNNYNTPNRMDNECINYSNYGYHMDV